MAKELLRDGVRRGLASVRARWPILAPGPTPLALAHQLLDDKAVEDAVRAAMMELGHAKTGVIGCILREDDGKCVVPFPEKLLPFLHTEVLEALRAGRLIARGLDPDNVAHGKPITIPADRWLILAPDFQASAAVHEGKTVAAGIAVEGLQAIEDKPPPLSSAETRKWFIEFKAQRSFCSEKTTWQAAQTKFGGRVTRPNILEIRKQLAPEWVRGRGRPRKAPK